MFFPSNPQSQFPRTSHFAADGINYPRQSHLANGPEHALAVESATVCGRPKNMEIHILQHPGSILDIFLAQFVLLPMNVPSSSFISCICCELTSIIIF